MFLGRCYTICNVLKWAKKFGPNLQLKTDFDVKVFVHSLWDEFWLNGINEIPFEMPFFILDTTNHKGIAAAVLSLTEVESIYLTKDEQQCIDYFKGELKCS